jgi:hypothetical protein
MTGTGRGVRSISGTFDLRPRRLGLGAVGGPYLFLDFRLALEPDGDVDVVKAPPVHGSSQVAAEALRRLRGGFVLGQLGGRLVPVTGDLGYLASVLECPLLVVR